MAWKKAPFNPLRVFIPNGTAITIWGTNRYTGQPVDVYGLTYEADALREAILKEFPDSPTKRNYAVDRKINHSTNPNAALSDHARGEALDMMVPKYDGKPGISATDRDYGDRLVAWLDEKMTGPVEVGLRKKNYVGPYRISYWVWNGYQHQAGKPRQKLKPTSNQHRNHVHISIVPVDRSLSSKPEKDPRRTLKEGMSGDDVRLVQEVVGAVQDGQFGPTTTSAVRDWQLANGLAADGIVGPKTWAKIDEVTDL